VLFDALDQVDLHRLVVVRDAPSGLRALIAIHDTTLGPAAGGVRTRPYPDEWSALREATHLARAMTYKCALAGLPCGGGKIVVMEGRDLARARAFEALGAAVESLGGLVRTAGDMGTHPADLRAMERRTRYVHLDAQGLDLHGATARGVVHAIAAAADALELGALAGLHVVVQGAGVIGTAVARALVQAGARVSLADLLSARAQAVAREVGAEAIDATAAATTPCDVFAPCAAGGVIDTFVADHVPCRIVCGAANNPLEDELALERLEARGVLYVPDFVASAGAVIEGIGASVLGLADRTELIDRIGDTTRRVIVAAREREASTLAVARALAEERIAEAMPKWRRPG
jgi:leucine dehydrogenase